MSDTTSQAELVEPMADADDRSASGEPCAELPLTSRIEALLLATDRPLTDARLGAMLGIEVKGAARVVRAAIDELNEQYESTDRAFRVQRLAGGWQLMTLAAYGPLLARLSAERQQARLSQAALETLSIIAYRQPIMRAEIEAIRGVACGEVLRGLLERRLVKVAGRAEELGRPMLYGTTGRFLKVFGLSGLSDLPEVEGLTPRPARSATRVDSAPADDSTNDAPEPTAGNESPDGAPAPESGERENETPSDPA